ncbi:hypothetical protein P5Z58_02420 [Limosilactobacillus mucosae]|nr:hypothetical protein [Limosilactobacillus mucosae]
MANQLTILKLMAKLDIDTSITFLQVLADDRYDEHDDYKRITMYCNDLLGQYRPSNDNAPWIDVRDKIASMDEQNGYDDTELVIDSLVRNINSDQLALLRTLAYGEQKSSSYIKGALDMYQHLGWKD